MHLRRNGQSPSTPSVPSGEPEHVKGHGIGSATAASACSQDDGTDAKAPARPRRGCYFSLAFSIGSMGLACGSLWQIPNTTDRITLQRGLFLTSLGFIYFISLTDFCNKYLLETRRGQEFRRKYRLMMSDVLEITNKTVSAIQASFSFLVGLIVCKSTCTKSFVYASHFLMEAYGWFGTAYFMYDIWAMYKVHTQKIADKLHLLRLTKGQGLSGSSMSTVNGHVRSGHCVATNGRCREAGGTGAGGNNNGSTPSTPHEICDYDGACVQIPKDGRWDFLKYVLTHPVMMIHHVFIGTFGLLVVTYIRGGGHCIYSYMFMMEFSTPFVSLRSILSTMRLKESRVYIANGLLMLATFFVCRVCMWPYVMWRYSLAIEAASLWSAMSGLPRGCLVSIAILFLPQLYWFYLMVLGAIKTFMPKRKAPALLKNGPPEATGLAETTTTTTTTTPTPTAIINGKN
ncbi:ceramide synthase [Drosophila pseudoobscura]|uniref:Ceramide synthase n=1 Tax=Drosophila pseudoobscura pseudoobscura TaxID=46245 RepID=A0A6I8UHJ0_DROPS|nr:ceramide synthase [Drosophila pseudoobscura]